MKPTTAHATSSTHAVSERAMANAIRALAMDAVQAAKSGHPGMPMGMADVATVLFHRFLKFDPQAPHWPDRDRFVLSAGHGSTLLYALLHLTGYQDFSLEELKNFRQLGAKTAGHPEYGHGAGIETTTGPLGQGIATAVGMAIAERLLAARFGDTLCDHTTYVIAGDGCLMEGISHEAIDMAGHLKLAKLIVLFDDNAISIDGATSLSTSADQLKRFEAAGWGVCRIDGHDPEAIASALEAARESDRPSLIACKTIIGYGAPNKQGTAATHGSPLGEDEIAATRKALDWPHAPFVIPTDIKMAWESIAERGRTARAGWEKRLAASKHKAAFSALTKGVLPEDFDALINRIKRGFSETKDGSATRVSSQKTLEQLVPALPMLLGGSADLTGSNGTRTKHHVPVTPDDFSGSYLHYGVREHGMAAAMNGLALHRGFIPYGGTFLVFADYARPAIRLAALMGIRVIHVLTHDSIGLGEDGPTHQPVETLASLRVIPNVLVFRPADAVEVAESWAYALSAEATPSVLALTRQNLPCLRTEHTDDNKTARGAYVLLEAKNGKRDVTLLASGSEVSLALQASEKLATEGIQAAVVSMPCFELFRAQEAAYKSAVLGSAPRIGVEAALPHLWAEWLGENGAFVGMKGFGASAPAEKLYQHFKITVDEIVRAAKQKI